jgi:hypothetical protein
MRNLSWDSRAFKTGQWYWQSLFLVENMKTYARSQNAGFFDGAKRLEIPRALKSEQTWLSPIQHGWGGFPFALWAAPKSPE